MDIISYLTALLQTSKIVGVAGLGTFYKKKNPGKYDAGLHAFIPPSFSISFVTDVEETDDLADYISEQRNITTESASYFIQEFVERVHAQLADHHEANLGELGKLVIQNEQIHFIPLAQQNFDKQFYGLPAQSEMNVQETTSPPEALASIEEENKLEEENPGQETAETSAYSLEHDNQPVYEEINEVHQPTHHTPIEVPVIETPEEEAIENEPAQETVASSFDEQEEDDEPKKGMGFWGKFFIVLALIVAIGAIAYFINPGFFDQYIQQNFEGKPVTAQPAIVPPVTKEVDSNKADSTTTKQAVPALNDNAIVDSTKMYYEVIGTSENTKLAADRYIARVAKRGIVAKHIQLSKTRFSVSLGTFTDPKPAEKFADSMRVMLKNKGIYTLSIKPKKHTK